MNQVLECIYSRSSVRKYLPDQVPESDVREIMKAGFHAANGLNLQAVRFIVIQDKAKIKEYNTKAKAAFVTFLESVGASDSPLMGNLKNPDFDIFYGAPTIIGVYCTPESGTQMEDGCLAVGNMMLAAESMGYGTCFIGFASFLGEDADFKKENNVPVDCKFVSMTILGKPDGPHNPHPRGEVPILSWSK